ncbi:AAA family ATPase [Desulfonauticus submarinus]
MNIQSIRLKNFMLFEDFAFQPARFNLFIGANDTGKTIILKLIYAVMRAYQEYKEKEKKNFADILSNKILWTFMPDSLGNLVKKGNEKTEVFFNTSLFKLRFSFTRKAKAEIKDLQIEESEKKQSYNTLFIPPKETISIIEAIRIGREEKEKYWFDDTYYTLVQALSSSPSRGKLNKISAEMLKVIKGVIHGDIKKKGESFYLKRDRNLYEINLVAEGLRKIGMIEWLIKNRSLEASTLLIMDEPESGLNPASIITLAEVIYKLSQNEFRSVFGGHVFVATHNFFFLKKTHILAKKDGNKDAKIFALENKDGKIIKIEALLKEQIPTNKILEVAMDLYNEEVKAIVEDMLK